MAEPNEALLTALDILGIGADWKTRIPDEIRDGAYGAAVAAAVEVMDGPDRYMLMRGHLTVEDVRDIVEAAAPLIERAVREKVAQELEWSKYGRPLGLGSVGALVNDLKLWAAAIARGTGSGS